jgi:protein-L-isoaspartate(D-aspartate) O-methyltransferase
MPFWSNALGDFADDGLPPDTGDGAAAQRSDDDRYALARQRMVERQLRRRDITDEKVLEAIGRVARHQFVPAEERHEAYKDHPVPIGFDQTISQPYIVALMTQLVRSTAECRALEVGIGSGYQAAVLAELCGQVYGVEIIAPLAEAARLRLAVLGYRNVVIRAGDGYQGWADHAPFDVIIVSAAPDHVPQPLLDQLAGGGRMVIPVGRYSQELVLIEKRLDGGLVRTPVTPVQFVPMTGEAQRPVM